MRYLLLAMVTLTFLCSCTVEKPEYKIWTLESSQYQPIILLRETSDAFRVLPLDFYCWEAEHDPFAYLESYPRYTFEYPGSFIQTFFSGNPIPPMYELFMKRYVWDNMDIDERKLLDKEEVWNEILEWHLARFEVYIDRDNSYPRVEEPYTVYSDVSGNESPKILDISQVIVDGIIAEKTTKRFYSLGVIEGANRWRIHSRTVFEYNGYTCYLVMESPEDKADTMMEYYNHLLETFQFLD